jgi:thiamine biosynthesis protein ThiS
VTVQLNGELREVPEGLTLAALIEWLKLPRDRVAVERNLEIVPRARWNVTPIKAGDRLEVVHLVGGGFSGGWRPRLVAMLDSCSPNRLLRRLSAS